MSSNSEYNGAGMSPEEFQEIFTERTTETKQRAQLKRLHDLRRIQEMKSSEGNHPLEIFPEELWLTLFDMLSPMDRSNIWNLHVVFRQIMEASHLPDNLFPQILNLKMEQFWANEEIAYIRDQAKTHLANYVPLRSVSKTLRNEIDHFIERDILRRLKENSSTSEPTNKAYLEFQEFTPEEISRLDECVTFTNSNSKFITRSIKLRFVLNGLTDPVMMEHFEDAKMKITKILQNAGENILHFQVGAFYDVGRNEDGRDRLTKMYMALVGWLQLLPNLKWLQFVFCCGGLSTCTDCLDTEMVRRHPPPKISSLERLDFTMTVATACADICGAICRAIIEANPQIKNFHLSRGYDACLLAGMKLNQLDTLEIGERNMHSPYALASTEVIVNSEWPLKRLTLRLNMEDESMATLLKFLQKFPRLEKVILQIKNVSIGGGIDFLRLHNLKEFVLDMTSSEINFNEPVQFFFSLQFLIYNKNLKRLCWEHEGPSQIDRLERLLKGDTQPRNLIDFKGGLGNLDESNIWKIFPYLEDVSVHLRDFRNVRRPVVKYQARARRNHSY